MDKNSFYGDAIPMQDSDYLLASKQVNIGPAELQAVTLVETNGSPFLPDKRPDILFEAHVFGRHTGHKYNNILDPNGKPISSDHWDRTLYGHSGAWQYTRLLTAMGCDPVAAVMSASFGAFQILGEEYADAGFANVEDFVAAMAHSAGDHLKAFCSYIQKRKIDGYLRTDDWKDFARAYNGPGYAANNYDNKMAVSYRKLVAKWASLRSSESAASVSADDTVPSQRYFADRATVASVQAALQVLPGQPLIIKTDGIAGPVTTNAIIAYETKAGLSPTGKVDSLLLDSLGIALPQ
jgi:hypothetical protein